MDTHGDRQLLFGVLALREGFVSIPQLVAAIAQWKKDESQSIDKILLSLSSITLADCEWIRAQVEGHSAQEAATLHSMQPQCRTLSNDVEHVSNPQLKDLSTDSRKRFLVLHPHAQGGLGIVSVALDQELNRRVALKEIRLERADDKNSQIRFVHEAEITGQLEHPGIVPVYGLGFYEDGRPFYAMRFVEGENLKVAIRAFHQDRSRFDLLRGDKAVTFRNLLGRFVAVCQAIEYAHSRSVLHRDLKPENILLGPYGETLVVDWGLAKSLDSGDLPVGETSNSGSGSRPVQLLESDSEVETLDGSAIGTPAFMSPEQASGKISDLGPASDIYSLGATLFTLLTGKPPVTGKNSAVILKKTRQGDIDRVTDHWPKAPGPLIAICKKAMSLEPSDRYPTAVSLAQDIENWLADETVIAYREPVQERASRFVRKNQTLVATAVILLMATTGLALLRVWYRGQLNDANIATERKSLEVQIAKKEKEEQESFAQVNAIRERSAKRFIGWSWLNEEDLRNVAIRGKNEEIDRVLREESARLISSSDIRKGSTILEDFRVSKICWSPDGKTIALGQNTASFGKVQVRLIDAESHRSVQTLSFFLDVVTGVKRATTDGVSSLVFANDGQTLFVGTRFGMIHQFELKTDKCIATWKAHDDYVTHLCLCNDGTKIISASRDNTIRWWDLEEKRVLRTEEGFGSRALLKMRDDLIAIGNGFHRYPLDPSVTTSNSISKLAIPSGLGAVLPEFGIVSAQPDEISQYTENGTLVRKLHPNIPLQSIDQISVGNHGKCICLDNGTICDLWDLVSGQKTGSIYAEEITCSAADPFRPRILIADNGKLDCYELREDTRWSTLPLHPNAVERVVVARESNHAFTSLSFDGGDRNLVEVRKWDLESMQLLGKVQFHSREASEFAVSRSGDRIAFVNFPNERLAEVEFDSGLERELFTEKMKGRNLTYSDDDQQVWLTASSKKSIAWQLLGVDRSSMKPIFKWSDQMKHLSKGYSHFTHVQIGKGYRIGAFRDSIHLWGRSRDNEIPEKEFNEGDFKKIDIKSGIVEQLAIIEGEQYAVAGTGNGQLVIIDLANAKIQIEVDAQSSPITAIATVGEEIILVGDASGEIAVWRWKNEKVSLIARLGPLGNAIQRIAPYDQSRKLAIHTRHETSIHLFDLQGLWNHWKSLDLVAEDPFGRP